MCMRMQFAYTSHAQFAGFLMTRGPWSCTTRRKRWISIWIWYHPCLVYCHLSLLSLGLMFIRNGRGHLILCNNIVVNVIFDCVISGYLPLHINEAFILCTEERSLTVVFRFSVCVCCAPHATSRTTGHTSLCLSSKFAPSPAWPVTNPPRQPKLPPPRYPPAPSRPLPLSRLARAQPRPQVTAHLDFTCSSHVHLCSLSLSTRTLSRPLDLRWSDGPSC